MSRASRLLSSIAASILGLVAIGATRFSQRTPPAAPFASDSVVIVITNGMPHPMKLAYDSVKKRVSLGVAAADRETTIVIRRLATDSVTVWASNDNPEHNLSRRFPSRSERKQFWGF